jgi:hypothetical protein
VVSERRQNVMLQKVLHDKCRATRRHWPHVRHNRDGTPAASGEDGPGEKWMDHKGIGIAIGLVIYVVYGRFQSRLRTK